MINLYTTSELKITKRFQRYLNWKIVLGIGYRMRYHDFYHPKTFADFAAALSNACFGSLMP
jgi:hypothetical protein